MVSLDRLLLGRKIALKKEINKKSVDYKINALAKGMKPSLFLPCYELNNRVDWTIVMDGN